jgi:Glycosyl hydrolase catalytic core
MLGSRPKALVWATAVAALALALAAMLPLASSSPALAASASASRARAHASSTAPLGGINIVDLRRGSTSAEADRAISLARTMHAHVVRTELPWAVFEPNGPGQIDPAAQAFTDRLMNDAEAAGIRVIATVDFSPCWASAAPASLLASCVPGQASAANGWPPVDPSAYAHFVGYLAQRYGSALAAIEIWNEPDQSNEAYFGGPNKAERYTAVLRAAYPAIKAADPHVAVLGGSFVGSNGNFLRALYAAGAKGYYDGLAVHFYTLTLGALRAIHEVQIANGDHTPLWLSEFGWSSCWPAQKIQQEQGCVTPATQALNLTNMFRSLAKTSYVAAELVYKLQDSREEDFGALTSTGARKPAFNALASVFSSPFGRVSPMMLKLGRRSGRVVANVSGPVGDYVQLEAFKGRALRYRALFELNRFNQYSLTLPRVLGSKGLRVRVYQLWTGPSKATQKSI